MVSFSGQKILDHPLVDFQKIIVQRSMTGVADHHVLVVVQDQIDVGGSQPLNDCLLGLTQADFS
jgi:hypothetical protein